VGEPVRMVQREARHREKEKYGKAHHRDVIVEPARPMSKFSLPPCAVVRMFCRQV
jgi:hypothetical protein